MVHRVKMIPCVVAALAAALTCPASAQRNVEIRPEKVADNVYVLYGQGGNIGLSVGDDGAFMIDDQFAPLTPLILEAVKSLTDKPVRFVINTHWHGDHTGGNENMAGEGAIIVAHENVRERMSSEQFNEAFNRATPASPDAALPVITFPDRMTFHWNGDDVHIFHIPHAHTDGDAIILFADANVFHMGDTYFSSGYPFIDPSSGGVIDGVIKAAESVINHSNESTKIIPGHGEVTGVDELRAYRDMLKEMRDAITAMIDEGKSKEEVIAAKPSAKYDEEWGGGFMQPDQWVGIVYDGIVQAREREHDGDGHAP